MIRDRVAPLLLAVPLLGMAGHPVTAPAAAEVPAATVAAFDRYRDLAEKKFLAEVNDPELFLDLRTLDGRQRDRAFAAIRRGDAYVRELHLLDADGNKIEPDGALIHHWIGTAFVPGARLESALEIAKNYDEYSTVFQPEVVASRLLELRGPDDMRVFLRFRKKKVLTFVYDTEHEVRYFRAGPGQAYSMAFAPLVREIDNAGKPDERRKEDGEGYLWRIQTYWRYAETDDGLYLETESLMLTRRVPFLARLIIGPIIRSSTREGVETSLSQVRDALLRQ